MRCPQRHSVVQFGSTETQKPSTQNENIFVNYRSRFCGDVKKPATRQPLLPVYVRISGREECVCDKRHRKRANPPGRLASLSTDVLVGQGPWSFSGQASRLCITHGKDTVMSKRMRWLYNSYLSVKDRNYFQS